MASRLLYHLKTKLGINVLFLQIEVIHRKGDDLSEELGVAHTPKAIKWNAGFGSVLKTQCSNQGPMWMESLNTQTNVNGRSWVENYLERQERE